MRRSNWLVPLILIGGPVALLVGLIALIASSGAADFGVHRSGGQIRVYLTDTPSDRLAEATVTIGGAYLVPSDGDTGSDSDRLPLELAARGARTLDLSSLRDGAEVLLGGAVVPEGDYAELRVVVDRAEVVLADGLTFDDGATRRKLEVDGGQGSGVRVELDAPLLAQEGRTTLLVVDLDLEGPAGRGGVRFTPSLKEKRRVTIDLP